MSSFLRPASFHGFNIWRLSSPNSFQPLPTSPHPPPFFSTPPPHTTPPGHRLVTYSLLHRDIFHLAVNLLTLGLIAPAIEASLGSVRFGYTLLCLSIVIGLMYTLATGVAALFLGVSFAFWNHCATGVWIWNGGPSRMSKFLTTRLSVRVLRRAARGSRALGVQL